MLRKSQLKLGKTFGVGEVKLFFNGGDLYVSLLLTVVAGKLQLCMDNRELYLAW